MLRLEQSRVANSFAHATNDENLLHFTCPLAPSWRIGPPMRACKQAKLVISHCSHFAEEDYVLVSILVVVCIRSQNYVSKIQLSYVALGEKHFQQDLSFPK